MLSCSIWFSAPSFWIGGGLESRCMGRVYGADGARHHPHRISHHFMSGFVSLHYSKWNDALRIQSNVRFYRPTYPDLMTSRGVPSAQHCYRTNYVKIAMIQRWQDHLIQDQRGCDILISYCRMYCEVLSVAIVNTWFCSCSHNSRCTW